jgi:hypothetical protein
LFASSLSISRDGRNVYVGGGSAIAEFVRNADGSLTQLSGVNNCIEEHGGNDCNTEAGSGVRSIVSLDVSSDGRNLYSSSGNYTGAVAEFACNADGPGLSWAVRTIALRRMLPGTARNRRRGVAPARDTGSAKEARSR